MSAAKRIVVISDLHCGHHVGLTPPAWQCNSGAETVSKRAKLIDLSAELWEFFATNIKALQPIDWLVVNGDLIDGRGPDRESGTEHFVSDRLDQAKMAVDVIKFCNPKHSVITYGTTFHVGREGEDFELIVAEKVGADKIGSHEWLDVNGLVFDFKHHIGSSSIPHGRYTAIARDALWNQLWALRDAQPMSDIIVRSHVHYHSFCGNGRQLAMTTPALQGLGSKYGSRRCSGLVDYGFIHFDVDRKGGYTWQAHIAEIGSQKAHALVA